MKSKPATVEYGVSEFGYTIRITYKDNTIEEFTCGNSPYDSTTVLDPKTNDNSVDKKTLLVYCLRSIEDLSIDGGAIVAENSDIAPRYDWSGF